MITTKVSLQLVDQTVPAIIPVVQGDTGRSIIFEPSDFTIPEGATATYYIQKPSGEAVYNSAEITGNTVVCNLTAQSIIETGENNMQVRIILGEDIVTSFDAILMVRPFRGIGAVESETEINIFDKAVEQAEQEISDRADEIIAEKVPEIEALVEEVIESIPEDYTQLSNDVDDLKADLSEFSGAVVDTATEKIGVKTQTSIDTYTWVTSEAVRADTGVVTSSTNFKRTTNIPCADLAAVTIDIPIYKSSAGGTTSFGVAFYADSSNTSFISGVMFAVATDGNTAERKTIPIPEGAKYFKTTWYKDTYVDYTYDKTFAITYDTQKWAVMETDIMETLGNDELCEYATVRSTDGVYEYTTTLFSCTSMIPVKSGTKITAKMAVGTFSSQTHGIAFYDANKDFVSGVAPNTGERGSETRIIDVPLSAKYFAIAYWNKANRELYGDFSCTYAMPDECINKKREYQSGYIFFSQSVNQSVNEYWNDTAETEQSYSPDLTTGVIALPAEYTPTGKPVPIIMYFHGYSHYVYMNHWGATEDFRTQKQHFIDAGFAVMDCNGGRNNNKTGYYTSGGSRQYVDGYKKCYEYIKEHYNVEDRCYIAGGSAGGIAAINYCFWFNDVKALMLLSAWSDLRTCSWDQGVTDTIIEYLGMVSGTYDASKAVGFDPAARIFTIDNAEYLPTLKVQTKALVGSTESSHVLYSALYRFINALRNAGQTATIREIEDATHAEVVSGGVEFIDNEIINWFKSI